VFRLRTDEGEAVSAHDLGEAGVLREEAIAGVDRLCPRDLAGGDDRGDIQIAFCCWSRADADALVG